MKKRLHLFFFLVGFRERTGLKKSILRTIGAKKMAQLKLRKLKIKTALIPDTGRFFSDLDAKGQKAVIYCLTCAGYFGPMRDLLVLYEPKSITGFHNIRFKIKRTKLTN